MKYLCSMISLEKLAPLVRPKSFGYKATIDMQYFASLSVWRDVQFQKGGKLLMSRPLLRVLISLFVLMLEQPYM